MLQRIVTQNINPQQALQKAPKQAQKPFESFQSILDKASKALTVSAHARDRIASRNIAFGSSEISRVESAMEKAQAKGSKESLVLLDGNAFVVSVRNRTIVTAMDGNNVRDNVFTNIDSAVIA